MEINTQIKNVQKPEDVITAFAALGQGLQLELVADLPFSVHGVKLWQQQQPQGDRQVLSFLKENWKPCKKCILAEEKIYTPPPKPPRTQIALGIFGKNLPVESDPK